MIDSFEGWNGKYHLHVQNSLTIDFLHIFPSQINNKHPVDIEQKKK